MPYHYNLKQIQVKHTGVLTILSLYPEKLGPYRAWLCQCICGKIYIVSSPNLVKQKSCGCLNKHGEIKTRLYAIWHSMKQRCLNEYSIHYRPWNTLQVEWRNYKDFRDWALTTGYNDTCKMKRIVKRKGFNSENCIWIVNTKQKNK